MKRLFASYLILLGLIIGVQQIGNFSQSFTIFWPVFLIISGAWLLMEFWLIKSRHTVLFWFSGLLLILIALLEYTNMFTDASLSRIGVEPVIAGTLATALITLARYRNHYLMRFLALITALVLLGSVVLANHANELLAPIALISAGVIFASPRPLRAKTVDM